MDELSLGTVRDLQLLTLGAQLRGGQATLLGQIATAEIFALVEDLTKEYRCESPVNALDVVNESGRPVSIRFGSDPDIAITEELSSGVRALVAVEIKGGTDVSNVHNRIGEAEKSHRKARLQGYVEFWTMIAADFDPKVAAEESPTTTRFFRLSHLSNKQTLQYKEFRDHLRSIVGIGSG